MKTDRAGISVSLIVLAGLGFFPLPSFTQTTTLTTSPPGTANKSVPLSGQYQVVERGADYTMLQKTTVEGGTNRVHRIVQLATGLNYTNAYGQLVESKEQITILPRGGAVANQGRHTVTFPPDIGSDVLKVTTPDGRLLQSRPLCVTLDDGVHCVVIGVLTNAAGWLTASNQVTYKDCFTGIHADLVCNYRRSGFECDLVFRARPPSPSALGLSDADSTIQLVTEFFNTQDPQQIPSAYDDWFGLQDDTLKFGKMRMGRGKAFATLASNSLLPVPGTQTPVYKSWLHLARRTFLVEQVPLVYLADELNGLPLTAKVSSPKSAVSSLTAAIESLPAVPQTTDGTKQILVAAADMNRLPGVVLDYTEIDDPVNQADFHFTEGVTYYLTGYTYFWGDGTSCTLEGGSILKFAQWAGIEFYPEFSFTCQTTPDNPAILTAVDDDSVGEIIPGSTGQPAGNYYAYGAIGSESSQAPIHDLRISYAWLALYWTANVYNCQFLNDYQGILPINGLTMGNLLFNNVDTGFYFYGGANINASFVTAHHVNTLVSGVNLTLTNSLLVCVTNLGDGFTGDYNATSAIDNGIFATAYGSSHYLAANSPYRNVGTTQVDPDALAAIQTMTTYAPQNGGWPDADTPDLGWHYSTTVLWDSDGDGLPDWWEIEYFGNLSHSAGDLDNAGVHTLLYDYQNNIDPTLIYNVLLGHWPFDNTNTWVGAQGQFPISFANIVGVQGVLRNAVLVDRTNSAYLRYHDVEANGCANINLRNGTVRFWFKPDWSSVSAGGTGPGGYGRMIEMGTNNPYLTTNSWIVGFGSGWWALYLSSDGNLLSFGTSTNGAGTVNLAAHINWLSGQWHQVVLTYTQSNSLLYLDGQFVTNGTGSIYYPNSKERAAGFRIGSDQNGANQARGAFDELDTYNYPLNAGTILSDYQAALPTIVTQPANQTVVLGGTATLSVAVSGYSPFSYQWYCNGAAIAGATSATLTINNVQAQNAGSYYVFVSNVIGSTSSTRARVFISPFPVPNPGPHPIPIPPGGFRGVDGSVNALAIDATSNLLYAGGYFTMAGNTEVSSIAQWNPYTRTWSPLNQTGNPPGNGVDGGSVNTIAIGNDGKIYVGGNFDTAGGGVLTSFNIAVWDPSTVTWSGLHLGCFTEYGGNFASVKDICIYGNLAYVIGNFSRVDGRPNNIAVTNIAVWDTSAKTWSAVTPIPQSVGIGILNTIVTPDGVNFYVGGRSGIAKGIMDGGNITWQNMDPNLVGNVSAICFAPDGRMFVGGSFYLNPYPLYSRGLAQWDGTKFVDVPNVYPQSAGWSVDALAIAGDNLIMAGGFLLGVPGAPNPICTAKCVAGYNLPSDTFFTLGRAEVPGDVVGINYSAVYALATAAPVYLTNMTVCTNVISCTNYVVCYTNESCFTNTVCVTNDVCTTNVVFFQGAVYAGGQFWSLGNNESQDCVWSIARWDAVPNLWSILAYNPPPSISLTAPADGAVYEPPANISIVAQAADDCSVTNVGFFENSILLGNVPTSSNGYYGVDWNSVPSGIYTITAVATDNNGATSSASVSIRVNAPPTVSITSPANGANFTAPANITVMANATDSDGTITRVDFYAGTTSIGSVTAAPYSVAWNNVPAGTYSLTAVAWDNDGASTTSTAVTINVH